MEQSILQGAHVNLWQPPREDAVDILKLAETAASERQADSCASTQCVEAPLADLSFSCIALHLIDSTVLLLRRRDILHCVRRFHQQLLQALSSTNPELQHAVLKNDCRCVEDDGRVCQEVLEHLADRLGIVLVVREASSLRVFGSSTLASVVVIERDNVYRITEVSLHVDERETQRIVAAARFSWIQDLQISHATLCSMRKAQVQGIADALGVVYHRNRSTKDSLVKLVVDCIGNLSRQCSTGPAQGSECTRDTVP